MDKLRTYKKLLKKLFKDYASSAKPRQEGAIIQVVTDDEHGQYLLYHNAWQNQERNYGCFLHISIRNDKIYIEHDGSNRGFTQDLLDAGIPKSDIVLAFHSPEKRPYTGFAIA